MEAHTGGHGYDLVVEAVDVACTRLRRAALRLGCETVVGVTLAPLVAVGFRTVVVVTDDLENGNRGFVAFFGVVGIRGWVACFPPCFPPVAEFPPPPIVRATATRRTTTTLAVAASMRLARLPGTAASPTSHAIHSLSPEAQVFTPDAQVFPIAPAFATSDTSGDRGPS